MKTRNYEQLNASDRERIFQGLRARDSLRVIAKTIGRSVSTVSREVLRNRNDNLGEYLPDTAMRKSQDRKKQGRKRRYIEKDPALKAYVLEKLKEGWSPEQIAGRMPRDRGAYFNRESIYQYVYGREGRENQLRFFLRRSHPERHRRHGRRPQAGRIPDRIDITPRPAAIETRRIFGHWEGDSMLFQSGRQALATQTERKSRFLVVLPVKNLTAKSRNTALAEYFETLPPEARQTITFDNGPEFSGHRELTRTTGLVVYFTQPYASWQKGSIENQNGLLRWYLPRPKNLNHLLPDQLNQIVLQINNRPRKCLNFQKPIEVFYYELNNTSNNQQSVAFAN
jgi:transposase, IS30 family